MARRKIKSIIWLGVLFVVASVIVVYYIWNAPRRTVSDEASVKISSVELVQQYQANEVEADKKYLNKAISVTGSVLETGIKSGRFYNGNVGIRRSYVWRVLHTIAERG